MGRLKIKENINIARVFRHPYSSIRVIKDITPEKRAIIPNVTKTRFELYKCLHRNVLVSWQ